MRPQEEHIMGTRRLYATVAVVALLAASLGAGTAVWAAHQFSDVDDTHPFHDEIAQLVDSCVAGGFPDGTFRPSNTVTRQAIAAFLARGLSRVEVADGPDGLVFGNPTETETETEPMMLATVDIDTPDLPECEQYVHLTGQATVGKFPPGLAACEYVCIDLELELIDDEDNVVGIARTRLTDEWGLDTLTVTAAVPAPGGTSTYRLQANAWLQDDFEGVLGDVRLVATTHPFSDTAAPVPAPAP